MARPERNNVDYFPHPINHGKKMFFIRNKYGNDGYTVWFMLLEKLGEANYHYLDLRDEVQVMYLTCELRVSEDALNNIINDLVKFGEFDKELWEKEHILFSHKFIESIQDAYVKRNNKCITYEGLLTLLTTRERITVPVNPQNSDGKPQSKVKYSKGKERKENIPPLDEFISYALTKDNSLIKKAIENKYDSWVLNGWKDGNNKNITNWKVKLLNTIPYMSKTNGYNSQKPITDVSLKYQRL